MTVAAPVLVGLLVVALLFGRGRLAWAAAVLALILGLYLGNTGFGHFVMSLVNML